MKFAHKAACAIALSALAAASYAKVIVSGTYSANFSFTTATAFVPLASTGATSRSFNAPKAATYVLTFSAECSVDAPAGNNGAWVDLDILIDGVAVSPTFGSADAFCGANGIAGFDAWIRPSITVPVSLSAGAHTLQVLGRLNNGATGGWVSDIAMVLHQ